MTFRPRGPQQKVHHQDVFPEPPPRDDMQNMIYLHLPGHGAALRRHLGASESTIVISEAPIDWRPNREPGSLVPDLLVAFNIDPEAVITRNGYAIDEQGKPPDFVIEVPSTHTARNDVTCKRVAYARCGVPEYWRFDPTGGERYPDGLAGDRLSGEGYEPIDITRIDDNRQYGRSEVLGLDICSEFGQLRWWDPVERRYLYTHDEEADGRVAEREGRLAAEERVRVLEAELQQLRGPSGPPGPEGRQ